MGNEKPWRVCGDYIKKLPTVRRITGVIVLPAGARYEPVIIDEFHIHSSEVLSHAASLGSKSTA